LLFDGLSFVLRPGDCLELRGPNGSGKTSLLRILCGLLPPASGTILWQGESIEALREAYHPFVAYVGHRRALKDELTTMENLRTSCALRGVGISPDEARGVLARMDLDRQRDLQARFLSAGQQRRLSVARLIASRARLWLLDEILTSLDAPAVRAIAGLIDEHVGGGGIAVVATHRDLHPASRRSQRIDLAA
jgi:heme exporter protein A